ncbi:hypothetical protein KJ966_16560 [bacterium]|nr:hypothetical protein [bacterium]
MRKIIIVILSVFWAVPVSSQVVVPSLDPVLACELASAIAWRVGSTVGIDVDYVSQAADTSDDAESKNTKQSVLISYQPGNFIGELYYSPYSETKSYSFGSESINVDWENDNGVEYGLRLAIRGDRRVSVGIGYEGRTHDINDYQYGYSHYEGSFSLRLFEGLLFLGAGMQRVTENLGSDDSRKMNRVLTGAAIQIGDPTDTIFKTEVSMKISPKTESDNDILGESPQTTESTLAIELLTGSFLFSYRMSQKVYEEYTNNDNLTEINNRYGLGTKLGSFTFSLYRNAWTAILNDETKNYDIYQATVGFNFL